jgi:hypothetical protein
MAHTPLRVFLVRGAGGSAFVTSGRKSPFLETPGMKQYYYNRLFAGAARSPDLFIFQVLREHDMCYFGIVNVKQCTDTNDLLNGKIIDI